MPRLHYLNTYNASKGQIFEGKWKCFWSTVKLGFHKLLRCLFPFLKCIKYFHPDFDWDPKDELIPPLVFKRIARSPIIEQIARPISDFFPMPQQAKSFAINKRIDEIKNM